MQFQPLFTNSHLFSHWEDDFQQFRKSDDEKVRKTLVEWSNRDKSLTEIQLNGLFVQKIFHQLWGYWGTGTSGPIAGYTLLPEFPVVGAGQSGGTGKADLALAHFNNEELSNTPQVLCEFKDISTGLDAPQNRKGNNRSPVEQCLDYLKHSFDQTPVNSLISPLWGVVTDMNEFRLYHRKTGISRYARFVIDSGDDANSLISDSPNAARQRFIFCRLFSRDFLLAKSSECRLEQLLTSQWTYEKTLEKNFYEEYQAYREHVYEAMLAANPEFSGTRGELVRMAQQFLDRCIFLLFCEDMGKVLHFPVHLLRDTLIRQSLSPTYSPDFDEIWSLIKQLFRTMRDGGIFPPDHQINRFNGGLFAGLEKLESLQIPNRIFCAKGQGESPEKLADSKNTLLYLSASYNFGEANDTKERTITLYTLGRIFEQSITDLEYMHAAADNVPTISKLSKRKRDGVYYTPEWVTLYIVHQVVGTRLEDERKRLAFSMGKKISSENLRKYRNAKRKPKANPATIHLERLESYQNFLTNITILDSACGSGAFLIQSLQYLLLQHHNLAFERERITGQPSLLDRDSIIRGIVGNNLFGVDINPESVEITQLALWLNTAVPDKPLSTLDSQIRCGNSLVDQDFYSFYEFKHAQPFENVGLLEQETVNPFDWAENFPTIMGLDVHDMKRGFDCIVGNPPYVKLQYFRKVVPDVAEYLVEATKIASDESNATRQPLYQSTQTKNFDLYLPFIERGVSLLHCDGYMGCIAPSLWLLNDHGKGLKEFVIESRCLDSWVDFKDFPVFEEAMTYTALQFFRGKPASEISFISAPNGQLSDKKITGVIDYSSLDINKAWVFLPDLERKLIDRLCNECTQLSKLTYVSEIFTGVQTSADYVYHLERVGPDQYLHSSSSQESELVTLEDKIMRPLLSGTEAKRYQSPETRKYLLFPYNEEVIGRPSLYSKDLMIEYFPNAWKYLRRYESELRAREGGQFDDDSWYRYGRNQNIDKQSLKKLGVAQTVPEMRVFYDSDGSFCLNNVRVNGIIVDESHAWFVLGILNSRVADFVFRRTSKPKEPRPSGSYFEANKQYIAPIPVPTVDEQQLDKTSKLAQNLEAMHTSRREIIKAIGSRIRSPQTRHEPKPASWIWAEVRDRASWAELNPECLQGRKLNSWAKKHYEQLLFSKISELNNNMRFGQTMFAGHKDGELLFYVGNKCVINGVYVSQNDAHIILPQWQDIARNKFVSESMNAKRIVTQLLDLRTTENKVLIEQLAKLTSDLEAVEVQIYKTEQDMDKHVYGLYKLKENEISVVENGTDQRVRARIPQLHI